ncbi:MULTISPECIES: hypothetical protein [unclassified Streptomyces]|uniref:hypothetical protein n=1 Tax=unclassified Streptomyces TaxID=2593676 RepID=UPI002255AFBD|nr:MULTISPECIES: hypothetical protein [unclassified Streptomyces]WSP55562.1 hypothetical protein OG306_15035 [Streptomyces sp. NBC_01241]WSU23710.1 hypothetical protein OG508_24075 [Streptomyces sp. NBC_01108]MCX4787256.1 hypothetical protein [Streptomyces sp. NBC_01221]MCX4796961.1 hypothetical protein [Streptomyces sp. NBC_01242]WSJ38274.1 hypothetical protein OG772_21180 [Streptomyces sp. NBC_01321]
MVSSQVLLGDDDAETVLDAHGLRVVNQHSRAEIPLAVVQEARTDGGRHVEIVLTDGVVHRVDGRNATAATGFVTALTAALPEQRDPAGSARVTVTALKQPEKDKLEPVVRLRLAIIGALILAYLGYAIWVGATRGPDVIFVIVGMVPLAMGLIMLFCAVHDTLLDLALRRRGITVFAAFNFRTRDGAAWYKFTDTDGVERSHRGKNRGPRTRVTYDPKKPWRTSSQLAWGPLVVKLFALTTGGVLMLLAGVDVAFLIPLMPE